MIIKSITLTNFRQYKGPITVNFSDESDKKVTVFIGDNSNGKSTLIQAFIWAIYNKEKLDLQFSSDVLNKDTLSHMYSGDVENVSVEVHLIHGGIEYIFLREQKYKCVDVGRVKKEDDTYKVWYIENGQTVRSSNPEVTKDKVLPEDLAEYFFFDGEHIKNLNEKKNLKKSLAKLLGLLPLQNAVNDLNKVVINIGQSIPMDGNTKLSSAIREEKRLSEELKTARDQLGTAKMLNDNAKQNFEHWQNKFSEIKAVGVLLERKNELLAEEKESTEKTNAALIACSKKFNSSFLRAMSVDLVEDTLKILDDIKEGDIADEAVPNMNAESVNFILKRQKCICGSDLRDHPELVKHIEELLNVLPPHSIGTELSVFKEQLEMFKDSYESSKDSFNSAVDVYYDTLEDLDGVQRKLADLDVKLKGVDADPYEDTKNEYNRAETEVKTSGNYLITCERKVKDAEKKLEDQKDDLTRLMDLDKKYEVPRTCREYAKRLSQDIERTRVLKEENMLRDFRVVLKEVFDKMYHGEREVSVDDNYDVSLLVPGVGETSISEGTGAVLGFAYVCTFLKMALDRMDEEEVGNERHALIMDAPTSTQDDKHIANVFSYTISVADQIILFINNKDWQYVKPVIGSQVDKVYDLNKKSEIITNIEVME